MSGCYRDSESASVFKSGSKPPHNLDSHTQGFCDSITIACCRWPRNWKPLIVKSSWKEKSMFSEIWRSLLIATSTACSTFLSPKQNVKARRMLPIKTIKNVFFHFSLYAYDLFSFFFNNVTLGNVSVTLTYTVMLRCHQKHFLWWLPIINCFSSTPP